MNRDLRLVILAMFTWGIGEGMFIFFQPLALSYWGASPVFIGIIYGISGLINVLVQLPVGYITDRIGPHAPMVASWVVGVIGAVVMAAASSLAFFSAGLLVYGLSMMVLTPLNSYLTRVRGSWSTQRVLTTTSAAFNLGAVIGPIVGGWIGNQYSIRSIYMYSILILVISTAIIMASSHQAPLSISGRQAGGGNLKLDKRMAIMLGLFFMSFFSLYFAQPLSPNFLQDVHGLDLEKIGALGSISSLGNTFILLAFGGMKSFNGIIIGHALVAGFAAAFWLGNQWLVFAAGYFLLGGYRLARSMIIAHTMPQVPPEEIGKAYGMIETMAAIAVILAPPIAGWVYSLKPSLIFLCSLIMVAISLLANLLILPRVAYKKTLAPAQEQMEKNT